MALPDTQVRLFAEELSTLRKDVNVIQQSLRSAQLGNSTIDNGNIGIKDSTGVLRGQVGIAADGSFAVVASNAPPPPAPSAPTVTPIATGVMVRWDGNFNGASRPQDFSFVEIWHNTTNDFGTAILDGNMTDPGEWPVAPLTSGGTHYFWLTATNTSRKRSTPSASASAIPQQVVAQALLDGIVTELKLANEAVAANKIKLGAVGQAQLGNQAVSLTNLANGSVDATKLVNGAVTQPAIAANAVTANAVAANSIIAGKVAADSISANELLANSVGASEIVANAVTSDKIVTNAVTADKINALAVTADKIAANAINAGHITAGAITAAKLATTLLLSTTIIAGTSTTGARVVLNSSGIEAYRANGTKSMDFDTATGNMTIAGQYRSADSGSRVEINPGGGAPDEMRFYQGSSNYAYVNAESAPGSTAAVVGRSQRVNNVIGAFGCYPTEAFLATQNTSISLAAVSILNGAANIWSNGIISLDARSTNGRVDFLHADGQGVRLEYRKSGPNDEAQLFSPQRNVAVTWAPGFLYVGDGIGNPVPVHGANFVQGSSRAIKKNERTPKFDKVSNARDGARKLKVKQFNYKHEWVEGEEPPSRTKEIRKRHKTDSFGHVLINEDTMQPLEEEEIIEGPPPVKHKPHFGIMAEDLIQILPELIVENDRFEGGLGLSWSDAIGYLMLLNTEQEEELVQLRADVDALGKKVK